MFTKVEIFKDRAMPSDMYIVIMHGYMCKVHYDYLYSLFVDYHIASRRQHELQ